MPGYCCQRSAFFVTVAVKWSNFFLCRMGKALCEHPFALHSLKPETYKQNVDVVPPGTISTDANGKAARGPSFHWRLKKRFPIPAVRNTAEWSFSKLRLIETFHRSTMTDERLTNLAMISIESETAETLDMTELTKTFEFLKTWKKSFS